MSVANSQRSALCMNLASDDGNVEVAAATSNLNAEQCKAHYLKFWGNEFRGTEDSDSIERLRSSISRCRLRYIEIGVQLTDLYALIFNGSGTANGHAFLCSQGAVAWFDATCYGSSLAADVFSAHEIAHAIQYQADSHFYFRTDEERGQLIRQLLAEGTATYVSKVITGCTDPIALWADYLSSSKLSDWMKACESYRDQFWQDTVASWRSDTSSKSLFGATDPGNILEYRAGYYYGLELIERVVSDFHLSVKELLTLSFSDLKSKAEVVLQIETSKVS